MADNGERFWATLSGYLVSLPYDLKVLFDAASEENLDRRARELATGMILYVLTPNDAPPPDQPHLAYVDEAILLRLALKAVVQTEDEGAVLFRERFPEHYDRLDEDLSVFRDFLGSDCMRWLERKIETLPRTVYRGKNVAKYLDDTEASEFLYEESLRFATEYELDEEVIGRVKRADPVRQHLHRRMAEEAKRIT